MVVRRESERMDGVVLDRLPVSRRRLGLVIERNASVDGNGVRWSVDESEIRESAGGSGVRSSVDENELRGSVDESDREQGWR
ncbi:hypothetical protein PGTUg99_032785 [Puccinia graminis f. sp. tritici]|uniref:Uncharacterized protein n=1 Tax=Puccinia graminis f. sp. tritici TaxID=56615 RepID=A0A5B0MFZ4_PUCGR|nr:hypothetical protein PGTUg99_032785 [Puccinia graminis f. sp. tritici]